MNMAVRYRTRVLSTLPDPSVMTMTTVIISILESCLWTWLHFIYCLIPSSQQTTPFNSCGSENPVN